MSRFEKDVLGMIPQEDWLDAGFDKSFVSRPNDPVDALVGDLRTDNILATWETIAAEFQTPVMAQYHAFDAEAQKTFRPPVDSHEIEKGLIKVKLDLSERLRALTRSGVKNDALYDYVMNDGIRLADQVVTRAHVAKNEMLATGAISINENGLNLAVDYGVPADQKGLSIDFGTGAADPVDVQLETLKLTAAGKGVNLNGAVTSRSFLNKLRKNAAIQKAINGNNRQGALVPMAELLAYLSSEYGLDNVVINDLTYGVAGPVVNGRPTQVQRRYFPINGITFFAAAPNGKLGDGLWGDPPETDVQQLLESVEGSEVNPFVFITQWSEHDPAVLWTKASALFIPVLYQPTSLFIATGIETSPA